MRQYRYLEIITVLYLATQLASQVTSGKITTVLGIPVSVTVLYFPVSYIFADILTEVYGYSEGRRALWKVVVASVVAAVIYQIAVFMPPARGFDADPAFRRVLGQVPRILAGGWIAVFAGEISNDYVLAKMKLLTKGRYLWTRTTGSTIVGELVNTVLFYAIALWGILPNRLLLQSVLSGWIIKVGVEVVMTPVTYKVVGFLKRSENLDYFDWHTDFNPFSLRTVDASVDTCANTTS